MSATTAQIAAQVRKAGYELLSIEQPRPNRWVLTLRTPDGDEIVALVQDRPLVCVADVADLAEILRLRRTSAGLLLALGGRFSAEAQRTAQELRRTRIQLCTALPAPAATPGVGVLEPMVGR